MDIDLIHRNLPGLEQYQQPSETQVKDYLKRSDPTAEHNNLFLFVFLFFLSIFAVASMVNKFMGSDVYILNKQIEGFLASDQVEKTNF